MTDLPFAITLDPGSSASNRTGAWRTQRPVYVDLLPPCNQACPAGENVQRWLYLAEDGNYEAAWGGLHAGQPVPRGDGSGVLPPVPDGPEPGDAG